MSEGERGLDLPGVMSVALDAAMGAGDILLQHLGSLGSADVRSKSAQRDLVTTADLASERHLVGRLRSEFPEHAIQAEEQVQDPGDPELGARWYLDPLDGTVNFVHQLPAFGVSMGLYLDGVPELAVVHLPRLGETFTATRGGGAFLGEERISISRTSELGDALLGTGFPYRRGELANNNLGNFEALFLEVRGLRRMGSAACDLAYTACGRLDAFWELHLAPHDVAAGALLVREAGGVVSDLGGGEAWLHGGNIVAGPQALCDQIRSRTRF